MTLTQMQYFIALANFLNFTEAARYLHITQPTLSRQIYVIEDELGMKLLQRENKRTRLTPAGEQLARGFGRILAEYEALVRDAKMADRAFSQSLRIGVLDFQSTSSPVMEGVSRLSQSGAGVFVEMRSMGYGKLLNGLDTGEIDIAITLEFEVIDRPEFKYKRVCILENCLVVQADHPNAEKPGATIADFKDQVFGGIVDSESPNVTRLMRGSCLQAGFEPRMRIFDNYGDLTIAIEAGQVVAGLSKGHFLFNSSRLRFVKVPEIPDIYLVAAWSPKRENPAIATFINLLPGERPIP